MLWIEGNFAGTKSERNILVQGPLSKSSKQEFTKKALYHSMNASDSILLSTV